jgi:Flp pilus assembly protein TadG
VVTRERGTVTVMTLGFLMLLSLLTVVVVDSSAAFLERQRLNNLADGAALAAADGLDEAGFYADRRVVVDPDEARRLVSDYLAGEEVQALDIAADGNTVTVRLQRELDLALTPPGWVSSTTIVADATAQLRRSR